jgi:hypothetical protein
MEERPPGMEGLFPGVNRPGRGVGNSLPFSAEVKEKLKLYVYSPCGPSWTVTWRNLISGVLTVAILKVIILHFSDPQDGGSVLLRGIGTSIQAA